MEKDLNHANLTAAAIMLLAVISATAIVTAGDAVVLLPQDTDPSVFADAQINRTYRVKGQNGLSAVLGWSLVSQQRTLARGEIPFTIKSSGLVDVSVPIMLPPVKPNVILQSDLMISLYGGDLPANTIADRRPLWIYPRDAFADRSAWLRSLEIVLFDPAGNTAAVLDRSAIAYRRISRPQDLDSAGAVAIVGEGVSIRDHTDLAKAAFAAARRGIFVLWLSPAQGHFTLPMAGEHDSPLVTSMAFRDVGVVKELDKRLDSESWAGASRTARTLTLSSRQDEVVVEVATAEGQWSWLQVHYAPSGTLVLCGLPLIDRWEESPTPRFLLLRILEHFNSH